MKGDKTRLYRDASLGKLEVNLVSIILRDYRRKICFLFRIEEMSSGAKHNHEFHIDNKSQNLKEDQITNLQYSSIFNCMYDVILNNEWKVNDFLKKNNAKIHSFVDKDRYAINIKIEQRHSFPTILYQLSPYSIIQQSRIAQKAIIQTLFMVQEPVPDKWLEDQLNLPEEVWKREMQVLKDLDILTEGEFDPNPSLFSDFNEAVAEAGAKELGIKMPSYRLTAKGRQRFEQLFSGFGKTVFVIVWCNKEVRWFQKFIKKSLKQVGFDAYVQELRDAGYEIGRDIKERIESSPFIIADLSGLRPNCFYELGFAHALHKRTIITCKKEDVTTITIEGTELLNIPFDISQYKISIWKKKGDIKFKSEVIERIKQHKEAIEQDYFLL